jgi:arylsulfatase A-like enzyme
MTRLTLFLTVLVSGVTIVHGETRPTKPNFLFVAIDDLNDFAGYASEEPGNFLQTIYPDPAKRREAVARLTPNLDRLAARSAPFLRSYCSSALCGPSRTSLMTGTLPHNSGYYLHDRHFRTYDTLKDAVTLPQHLKANGYQTIGLGKLFHKSQGSATGPLEDDWADVRYSWTRWIDTPQGCDNATPSRYSPPDGGLMTFGPSRLSLQQSGDWITTDFAARLLETGKADPPARSGKKPSTAETVTLAPDQPFFLGCGIFRPHLPFHAPKEFFDLFPTAKMEGLNADSFQAILADLQDLPPGTMRFNDFRNGKMKDVMDHAIRIDGDSLESKTAAWRELVQSYLACVSFADACIGRLVDGLEKSAHRDNTIVILWSDHGFHVGAKYHIAKQALWEAANRTTLIIRDPRLPSSTDGKPRRQIVSLMDLYPTVCSLSGITPPQGIAGQNLTPLLSDAAASQIHAELLMTYMPGNHALRTPTHTFTRYADGTMELYDMRADPSQIHNLLSDKTLPPDIAKLRDSLANRVTELTRGEVNPGGKAKAAGPTNDAREKRRAERTENP